jgi:5-methylcytosine-specific restriction endonuclease McrA
METSGWGRVFDEIKAKEGLTSDAKLAQSLDVSRTYICAVRKNRKGVSNELGKELYQRLGRRITEEDLELFMSFRIQKTARPTDLDAKAIVLKRANGICELCTKPAPFLTPDGKPYLEIHQVVPNVFGGSRSVNNLVALCPNCHRKSEICPSIDDLKRMAARAGSEIAEDHLRALCGLARPGSESR